ncbi:mucin-5AC [Teleopsis dalmanni]|uniref:mucin-5AC n=1 Tax=Teleopsis dalmanni TaxID=139649 RepID=UPI0018CE80E4|nr:mucin-5AC [Teleopsis dalmanni]
MITDRFKSNFPTICCWLILLISSITYAQSLGLQPQTQSKTDEENVIIQDSTVRTFSPRVDYNNEWRPVGRGDPLKNDPTYDYSPPALERVRYWADSSDSKTDNKNKETTVGTTDIVLIGSGLNSNIRKPNPSKNDILLFGGTSEHTRGSFQTPQNSLKNMKGETPLLQPKYTSIRRSYYGHQLPTRLMPPPMQTISQMMNAKSTATSDYRHLNMPSFMPSGSSSLTGMGTSTHNKNYYNPVMNSTWIHSPAAAAQHYTQRYPSAYDSHYQESMNYVSYTRPSSMAYVTNAIRPNQNALKYNSPPRKPWVHELLQKEVIKSVKPTISVTKYMMGSTKPMYESMVPIGISTTYSPVSFVSSTTLPTKSPTYAHSTTPVFITPTTYTTTSTITPSTYTRKPVAVTVAMPTNNIEITTPTTTTTTSSRLLIPNTSNLLHRPTVAPMEMTTDSLFSHYKQPAKPIAGPMYLIIEGHSKVKTYGKNEIDPHQPKIVPIIPKREPIVRIADPNEKRGTVETFQVKHLHTKTTPTTATTTTTTVKPITTTTTAKPTTTTIATTTTTATNNMIMPITTANLPLTRQNIPTMTSEPQPPTGMQGLLSLLDSSLNNLFHDVHLTTAEKNDEKIFVTPPPYTTILKPITTTAQQQLQVDARVSSKGDSLNAINDITLDASNAYTDEVGDAEVGTTEPAPRDVRQVFDYDQLPESRLKQRTAADGNIVDDSEDDVWFKETYDDVDEDASNMDDMVEYEDASQQLLKRIDTLVGVDDNVDDLVNENNSGENDEDDIDSDEFELRHARTLI